MTTKAKRRDITAEMMAAEKLNLGTNIHYIPINRSGIQPTEYKVLISPIVVDEKTKGGIILPDEFKGREQFAQMQGTLVAVSPLAFTYADEVSWGESPKPKPGDKVLFAKFAGAPVKGIDGKDYRIVNDKDIAAIIN